MTYVGTYVEVVLELISIRIAQMVLLSLRRAIGAVVLCCSVTFCVSFSCHCQHQHTFLDFDSGLKTPPPLITVRVSIVRAVIEDYEITLRASETGSCGRCDWRHTDAHVTTPPCPKRLWQEWWDIFLPDGDIDVEDINDGNCRDWAVARFILGRAEPADGRVLGFWTGRLFSSVSDDRTE